MKYFFALSSALFVSASTYGQLRLEAGPHLGLDAGMAAYSNISPTSNSSSGETVASKYALGGEIGGTANLSWRHWAVQASALYARRGFHLDEEYRGPAGMGDSYNRIQHRNRLDYLTLPVSLAYTQRADGQGLQVFAGGYVGRLLGGRYTYDDVLEGDMGNGPQRAEFHGSSPVEPLETYEDGKGVRVGRPMYLRPWDAGVQAGVGYRHQRLLLQLGYRRGLRDLGPSFPTIAPNFTMTGPSYKLRGVQLSASYLLLGGKQ
jgi:hypothetical protein